MLHRPAAQDQEPGQHERVARRRGLELADLLTGPRPVAERQERPGEADAGPGPFGGPWICREQPAKRLRRFEPIPRGQSPPAEPEDARLDERMRPRPGEALEIFHGRLVLAHPAQRVAEPEGHLDRQRARNRALEQLLPGLARLIEAAQPVECDGAPMRHERREARNGSAAPELVEARQRPSGVVESQRDPPQRVGRVRGELIGRPLLGDQKQVPLRGLVAAEAQERLREPVARFPDHGPVPAAPHHPFQGGPGLLQLVALEAGPPALEKLGGHAEHRAERIAREEPRRRRRSHRLPRRIRGQRGRRQRREAARRVGEGDLREGDRRLVERRRRERKEAGEIRRRQLQRERGGGAGQSRPEPDQGQEPRDPAPHDLGFSTFGWAGGLDFARTAASRSLAHCFSALSGLSAATSA